MSVPDAAFSSDVYSTRLVVICRRLQGPISRGIESSGTTSFIGLLVIRFETLREARRTFGLPRSES
jgi:hypothetical protein